MPTRTFETPARWGIGPGPANLYSIDGALSAVDTWLELMPARPETRRERDLMLTLRDILARIPPNASTADLKSAKRAIKGMVKYATSAEARLARFEGQMSKVLGLARRPLARSKSPDEHA